MSAKSNNLKLWLWCHLCQTNLKRVEWRWVGDDSADLTSSQLYVEAICITSFKRFVFRVRKISTCDIIDFFKGHSRRRFWWAMSLSGNLKPGQYFSSAIWNFLCLSNCRRDSQELILDSNSPSWNRLRRYRFTVVCQTEIDLGHTISMLWAVKLILWGRVS